MEARLRRYRALKIDLTAMMAADPKTRGLVRNLLEMNDLIVEALQDIRLNRVDLDQARGLIEQARQALTTHAQRLDAVEARLDATEATLQDHEARIVALEGA